MVDRYAVFGHPIGHSKSPRIHTLFAEQTSQALSYGAQDVAPESFGAAVDAFFSSGGKGLNCTVPLKERAYTFAAECSGRAQRAKAVNTLLRRADGRIFGDNTDGIGLLRDLTLNLGLCLKGRRILLLGAGGASRGVLQPLLEAHPEALLIANRTADKAMQLAAEFADTGPIEGGGFDLLAGRSFDVILNATAASLSGELPPLPERLLAPGGCCYDLAYGDRPTPFVRWGCGHGAAYSVDGLGMLIEQAAEAFYLWRGVRPDTAPVIALFERERRTTA